MPDSARRPRDTREDGSPKTLSTASAHEGPVQNLPVELSSFIGREREISEVRRLLGETHLVTLTGPGGTGKSRLALAAVFESVQSFAIRHYEGFVGLLREELGSSPAPDSQTLYEALREGEGV